MITIGLYEFLVFFSGIFIYVAGSKTRANIRHLIAHNDEFKIMFANVFIIILCVHASIYCFFFLLYLLFIGFVYYYFRGYDGFVADKNKDEIDEESEEEAMDVSIKQTKTKKQIEGIIRKERSISKIGV